MNNFNKIRRILLPCLLLLGIVFSASAQKYGHLNSSQLMVDLPSIKAADAQLKTFQEQLVKVGEGMMTKFQASYQDYVAKSESGTISQIEAQGIEATLQKEQTAIQSYEQEVQNKVLAKRQELYDPIFASVRSLIEQYGKDNGYTMIFDSGLGAILFNESEDLTEKIKAKL